MAAASKRVVIVGAGVNGLVAACLLARQGHRPLVLERSDALGGVAVTREFSPGFRASMVAPTAGPLLESVAAEMQLEGVEWLESPARAFLPAADGPGLTLWADEEKCAAEIGKISPSDAPRYLETRKSLEAMSGFFTALLEAIPPAMDDLSSRELLRSARLGLRLRSLGRRNMLRALRWLPMPAADLASEWFENEALRTAIAARGVFAARLGPRSPGTAGRVLFQTGPWGDPFAPVVVPRGGMGALAAALGRAARAAGAEVRTAVEVSRILVTGGRVSGVELSGGERIDALAVVSSADPARTLTRLVDPAHLAPSVLARIRHYRIQGSVAIVHLALNALPRFIGVEQNGSPSPALSGRILIADSVDSIERAFDEAKYGKLSGQPFLEATIPTILDPSLAPPGRHVLTAWLQYAPYDLREGNWEALREDVLRAALRLLESRAPGISSLVAGSRVLTPADLEREFALTGGHVFHGDLAMDQMFSLRPIFGFGRYLGPVPGLYFCGSGTHPGIGVTGASGRNAARAILADLRRENSQA